jgi:NADP-dependent 3-hydroxy acid dehydrogenase YdfG
MNRGVAVVTGASSGIGAAIAHRLAAEGFDLVLGARRLDRLKEVAAPIGATALPLDVTDAGSVATFCEAISGARVLVNNAGGARGFEPIEVSTDADWAWMFEANVLGTVRMTRTLLPQLLASGNGHVVMIGSVAGIEAYPNGAGYNAAKFGVRAFSQVLRQEQLGRPLRVTEVDPGMVETEFSIVRFRGDVERAHQVYDGVTPLTADDVADAVAYAVTRPPHVNVDQLVITSRDQALARMIHRHPKEDG